MPVRREFEVRKIKIRGFIAYRFDFRNIVLSGMAARQVFDGAELGSFKPEKRNNAHVKRHRVGAGGEERVALPFRKRVARLCERADQRPGVGGGRGVEYQNSNRSHQRSLASLEWQP